MKIQNQFGYIKGITFAPFHKRGSLSTQTARDSFDYMIEHTSADFVILAPVGLQDHAHSEEICYTSSATFSDEELINMIRYAKSKRIRVALKPTVNCKNGVWRAYISFFEKDVPCEPKWENWFASYTEFQTHYAKIAEAEQCDLFIAGCEMVMTEHRSEEWRNVIAAIRNYYHGPVSYNTDKYQEENVTWWDCVDMISSSGYYPIDQWEQELDRIERVVQKFKKPFFFAEAGCMSRKGSSLVPNNWAIQGALRLEEQPDWYRAMFEDCAKRSWVNGFAMWEWAPVLPSRSTAARDASYEICNKPSNFTYEGTAKGLIDPTIDDKSTIIGSFRVEFNSMDDTASYTLDVVNNSGIDAVVTSLVQTEPICTGKDEEAQKDANLVCSHFKYKLAYKDGTDIKVGDVLKSNSLQSLKISMWYEGDIWPVNSVDVDNLSITL